MSPSLASSKRTSESPRSGPPPQVKARTRGGSKRVTRCWLTWPLSAIALNASGGVPGILVRLLCWKLRVKSAPTRGAISPDASH